MTYRDQLEQIIRNLPYIMDIKLEDCKPLNEYSVVVLYENDSDIIICENSAQANLIYKFLVDEVNFFKLQQDIEDHQSE